MRPMESLGAIARILELTYEKITCRSPPKAIARNKCVRIEESRPSQDGTYSHHLSMANLPHIEGRHLATTCGGQRFSSRLKRCHLVLPFKRGARPVRAIKPRRPVAPFRNTVLALSGHLSPSHSPLARFRSPLDRGNACARPSTLRRFCCVAAPYFLLNRTQKGTPVNTRETISSTTAQVPVVRPT